MGSQRRPAAQEGLRRERVTIGRGMHVRQRREGGRGAVAVQLVRRASCIVRVSEQGAVIYSPGIAGWGVGGRVC